jgi:hypothetical protein
MSKSIYPSKGLYRAGGVQSIVAGTGLSGSPSDTIERTGTISLADTAVSPNTYTLATVTVDQQGRITFAESGSGGGAGFSAVTLTSATNQILIQPGGVGQFYRINASAGPASHRVINITDAGADSNMMMSDTTNSNILVGPRLLETTSVTVAGNGSAPNLTTATTDVNSVFGRQAGLALTTGGANNAIFGESAGQTLTTGTANTIVGVGADVDSASATNRTVIGRTASGTVDNQVVLGNSSVTSIVSNGGSTCSLGTSASPFQKAYFADTSNQIVLRPPSGNTVTLSAGAVGPGSLTYTIPNAQTDASFVMTAGIQSIAGRKTFTDVTQLSSPTVQLYLLQEGKIAGYEILATSMEGDAPLSDRILGIPDPGSHSSFVLADGNQELRGIMTLTAAPVLAAASNQLKFQASAVGNTMSINMSAPAANRVYTIPDAGTDTSFVMAASSQTVAGAKTFSSAVTVTPTTNQLVLGTTNTTTVSAAAPSASRVVTIPDPGTDASFVMTAGAQTIAGTKTFSGTIQPQGGFSSTSRLDVNVSGGTQLFIKRAANSFGYFIDGSTSGGVGPSANRTLNFTDPAEQSNFVLSNLAGTALNTGPRLIGTSTATIIGNSAAPNYHYSVTGSNIVIGPTSGTNLHQTNTGHSVIIGRQAATAMDTPTGVIAIGYQALANAAAPEGAVGIGYEAGYRNTDSGGVTCIGYQSGRNSTGQTNTFVGAYAGGGDPGGAESSGDNTAVGGLALSGLTSGTRNVCIGAFSGQIVTTGNNNIIIGETADPGSTSATNRIVIGQGVTGSNDNEAVIGNSSCTSIVSNGGSSCGLGTSATPFGTSYINAVQRTGTITNKSVQVNGTTTNTSVTSASFTSPFLYGAISEIYLTHFANSNGGFTSNAVLTNSISTAGSHWELDTNGSNADYEDIALGTQPAGVYKISWSCTTFANRGIIDVSVKHSGSGSYTNIRTQVDGYIAGAGNNYRPFFEDYVTVTASGSFNIRWTANGKNASSSAYYICLAHVMVHKLTS